MKGGFALYRSVWFWLGGFVLLFLVWVWGASWKTRMEVSRDWFLVSSRTSGFGVLGQYGDHVAVDCGSVWIHWNEVVITDPTIKVDLYFSEFSREAAEPVDEEWLAMPGASREVDDFIEGVVVTSTVVQVPMWVVTGLYVMLCGGVVWWRRRRWMRWKRAAVAGAEG